MRIRAHIRNSRGQHAALVGTGDTEKHLSIVPRESGFGSSVNGGELLFLALATCYGNDIYREAGKRGISITSVDVEVNGEFGVEGAPATRIEYAAKVVGSAPEAELLELMASTDRVSEVQNTVRRGLPVTLTRCEAAQGTDDGSTDG